MIAMSFVIVNENLQDQKFIDEWTVGFDEFRDYLFGRKDGVVKSPEWAAAITGIPPETIAALAREYACNKPAVLATGFGAGTHRHGRAVPPRGGRPGGHHRQRRCPALAAETASARYHPYIPSPPNQVEAQAPPRWNALPFRGASVNSSARVNVSLFADAILKGRAGGYPADYKMLWLSNTNYLNQLGEVNKTAEAFRKLDFMLVTEQFMTSTARFADIVLPVCTFLERNDLYAPMDSGEYCVLGRAINPLGESKSQLDICSALASKLGIPITAIKPMKMLVRQMVAKAVRRDKFAGLRSAQEFRDIQARPVRISAGKGRSVRERTGCVPPPGK